MAAAAGSLLRELREETVRDLELCRESHSLVVGRMRGLPDGSFKAKLAYQADVLAKWISRYRERLGETP